MRRERERAYAQAICIAFTWFPYAALTTRPLFACFINRVRSFKKMLVVKTLRNTYPARPFFDVRHVYEKVLHRALWKLKRSVGQMDLCDIL